MPIHSLLASLHQQSKKDKRLLGVITVAILVIASLGVGYYLYIESNESYVNAYKLKILDNYYNQLTKEVTNQVIAEMSIEETKAEETKAKETKAKESNTKESNTKEIISAKDYKTYYENVANHLLSKKDFDQLLVRVNVDKGIYDNDTFVLNAIDLPEKSNCDILFNQSIKAVTKVDTLTFMGQNYRLFARSFTTDIQGAKQHIQFIGLLKESRFKSLTRQLDLLVIALLATFLFVCIFGLPLLKLWFVKEQERLHKKDLYFAGYTTLIGTPLLLVVALATTDYSQEYFVDIPKEISQLSIQINNEFTEENAQIVKELHQFSFNDNSTEPSKTLLFKNIYKVQTSGPMEIKDPKLNFIKKNTKSATTLKKRPYYQEYLDEKNIWKVEEIEYYLTSVVAIEDQKEEAVYITNFKNDTAHCKLAGVELKSVQHAIMPLGYQFAVIDLLGNVRFHSKPGRATVENLFNVSNNTEELKAAISGRIAMDGKFDYHGVPQLYACTPIANTNLSVVVFYDVTLLSLRMAEIISMSCGCMLLLLIVFSFIALLALVGTNKRKRLYKSPNFLYEYLMPKKDFCLRYIFLSLLFWTTAILVIVMFEWNIFPRLVTIIFPFAVSYVCLLLIYIVLKAYKKGFTKTDKFKHSTIIPFLVQKLQFIKTTFKFPYYRWYSIFLFSWLFICAVLPTYTVYKDTLTYDNMIWQKSNLYEKISNITAHQKSLESNFGIQNDLITVYYKDYGLQNTLDEIQKQPEDSLIIRSWFKMRPIFQEKIRKYQSLIFENASDGSWYNASDKEFSYNAVVNDDIKHISRPYRTQHYVVKRYLIALVFLGLIFLLIRYYVHQFIGFSFRKISPYDFDTNKECLKQMAQIFASSDQHSNLLIMGPPKTGKNKFCNRIIVKLTDEVGSSNVLQLSFLNYYNFDDKIQNYSVFCVHDSDKIKANNAEKTSPNSMDWMLQYEVIVLDKLEQGVNSIQAKKMKLKLLSFLMANHKKLIVISEIYPSQVLASYREHLEMKEKLDQGDAEVLNDYESWRNLFGSFTEIILGITDQNKKIKFPSKNKSASNNAEIISKEIGFSGFLPNLATIVFQKFKDVDLSKTYNYQQMVLFVESMSYGYYSDIWNSLLDEERYLLFDLAEDGVINIKNSHSIYYLMKKGIVVWRDRPALFNESFRHFITATVTKEEALRLEQKNKTQNSWGNIKVVVYLIIITIIVFIILGKPDIIEHVEAIVAAVGGLSVVVPLFTSFMGRSRSV